MDRKQLAVALKGAGRIFQSVADKKQGETDKKAALSDELSKIALQSELLLNRNMRLETHKAKIKAEEDAKKPPTPAKPVKAPSESERLMGYLDGSYTPKTKHEKSYLQSLADQKTKRGEYAPKPDKPKAAKTSDLLSVRTLKNKWIDMEPDERQKKYNNNYADYESAMRMLVDEIIVTDELPPAETDGAEDATAEAPIEQMPTGQPPTGNQGVDAYNYYSSGQYLIDKQTGMPSDVTQTPINMAPSQPKGQMRMAHDPSKTVDIGPLVDPTHSLEPLNEQEQIMLELLKKVQMGIATPEEQDSLHALILQDTTLTQGM